MIKFLTKQNIANAAKSYHEYVGPVVVFLVELFNVYYVAICMQASKSIVTSLIIMATDTFHVILALRAIFHHRNRVHTSQNNVEAAIRQPQHYLRDLPALLREVVEENEPSNAPNGQLRLFAPFALPLSTKNIDFMNELVKTRRFANDKATNRRCSTKSASKRTSGVGPVSTEHSKKSMPTLAALAQHRIAPASPVTQFETGPPSSILQPIPKFGKAPSSNVSEETIYNGLQTLFHSEYILLAEYIEFMVPTLYALYLAVLFHLPVAAFYPHTASMTVHKLHDTATNILIYAAIEFAAFGALLALLKRKFGFSPLYQLAFVLETQAPALQGHLFVWTITILHLTLTHYGTERLQEFFVW